MKWFYNLKRVVRNIIAVVAWLPLVIFAAVISGSIGENGENMQAWQAVVVLVLLAVGVVFTVFAVLARRRETKAERDAKAAARTPSETEKQRAAINNAIAENSARQAELRAQIAATKRTPAPLKKYPTKVKITAFDKRIEGAGIKAGDDVTIKFEDDAVMQSSGGYPIVDANCYVENVKIGLFPYGKYLRAIYGKLDYNCTVASIDVIDGKYEVYVDIDLPFKKDSKLPLSTKLNGVTFGDRQSALAASVVGDSVIIKHNPNDEYPNTVEVFNTALGVSVGVIPSENGEKLLKKYKAGCAFDGVITSIYGGGSGKNFGVDIMILSQIEE
ncbi:MAG: hypothetical protein NC548_44285 [Lachnospiraceae bacterium]|nr:hypothetical protein [Lachnospiraceae bacterium]